MWGDELHHDGWNRCSSACHGPDRSHLIVPGFRSSRIHIVNAADDPRRPRMEKVIEPRSSFAKPATPGRTTVHCMPGDNDGTLDEDTAPGMIEATAAGSGKRRDPGERRIDIDVVEIHGPIATVVVHSNVYREYLHLGWTDEGWKIVNALWDWA